MSDTTIEQIARADVEPVAAPVLASDEQLVAMLVDRARSEGLQLTGEGGLLQQLTKRVLESALEGEITDHLGYEKHDAEGRGSGNSRNGTRAKTVLTDVGPVKVNVPRDVAGTFEPAIVKKRQRRLSGVDEVVLSLSAKGLTHGEISAHLAEVYGASVSKATISTITDKVMDGMAEWSNRPLDSVYPVLFVDSFDVEIRKVICSTNAIESVNARIRKAVRARGHFPNEAAAMKCVYMALMSLDPTGKGRKRWTMRWKAPLNAFQIAFEGWLTPAAN